MRPTRNHCSTHRIVATEQLHNLLFLLDAAKCEMTTFNLDDLPDLEDVDISECGDFSGDNSLVSRVVPCL